MRRRLALAAGAALTVVTALAPPLSGAATVPRTTVAWHPVKGIAVDLASGNQLNDAQEMQQGAILFSTIATTFHANAVSLNFPLWQSGIRSNDPEAGPMTPSPSRLAMLTLLAEKYGLTVQYRPYLYEKNLKGAVVDGYPLNGMSRPSIAPTNVALWFRNYATFLHPYLVSAAQAGAASFSIGLEFTTLLPYLAQWEQLVVGARALYPGPLFYSQQHFPQASIPGTERGYDAYQPICPGTPAIPITPTTPCKEADQAPRLATVAAFTSGFRYNLTSLPEMQSTPRDLTIEELAIPAAAKAYLDPNDFFLPANTRPVRSVQANWFAGACRAFYALHLAGIYFWSIDFNSFKLSELAPSPQEASKIYPWLGTSTQRVIESCFARRT